MSEWLETPVSSLEISFRLANRLNALGFKTVADLLTIPQHWPHGGVQTFTGIGPKAAMELETVLCAFVGAGINPRGTPR